MPVSTDTTYATTAELKARLPNIGNSADSLLQQYLNAAAEEVDAWTRGYRPPVVDSGGTVVTVYEAFSKVTETRLYDDDYSGIVAIDDCLAVTQLLRGTADITTEEAGSPRWRLDPPNLLPAQRVLLRADATVAVTVNSLWYGFPFRDIGVGQISITGDFGFCAAAGRPHVVKEATLMIAAWAYEQEGVSPKDKMQAMRDPTKPFYWEVEARLKHLKRGSGVRFA